MTTRGSRRPAGGAGSRLDHLDPILYRRWVRMGTGLAALGYALVTVTGLVTHGGVWYGFYSQAPTSLCLAAAWLLAHRDRPGPAALLAIGVVWAELQVDLPLVGIHATALIAFPLLVMAAGIIRGGWAAILLAGATSLTIPLTVVVGFALRGLPVPAPMQLAYDVVITSACMFAAAALVELGLDSFGRVLAKARAGDERISVLIAHAPVGLLAADADGCVTSVNPTAEALIGDRAAPLVGQKLDSILLQTFARPEDVPKIRALMRKDGATTGPFRLHRRDGEVMEIEGVSTPVPWADGSLGTQVILRDITERRRAEEKERVLQAQIERAQRLEAVGRLAGGVAHDFNNLLTVVGTSSEMLLEETEGHARELAQGILDAKLRGTALTRQLLAFARKEPIRPRRLHLPDVVRGSLPLLRRFLTEDIELVVDADGETPAVTADPAQVEQVLANLVINARDALSTGGRVTVSVHSPGSARSWAGRGAWVVESSLVEMSVEDDGMGMARDVQDRIFEPFFTTKPRGQGTGLGLASVHGIMTQNGGKVRVLSEPGVGTCMLLYWPVTGEG